VTAGSLGVLVLGAAVAAAGAVFAFNIGGASQKVADFYGKPGRPRAWRRNRQDEPRFWKAFGMLWLVLGLVDIGLDLLSLGR